MRVISRSVFYAITIVVASCVILIGHVSAASQANNFEVTKTKLLFLLSNTKFDEALLVVNESRGDFDGSAFETAWNYWSGVTYSRNGQLSQASASFEKATAAGFDGHKLNFEYGFVLLRLKSFDLALGKFDSWLLKEPEHLSGLYYRALSLFELKQYEKAVEGFTFVDSRYNQLKGDVIAHDQIVYMLAVSYLNLDKLEESKIQIGRILNQTEPSPFAESAHDIKKLIAEKEGTTSKFNGSVTVSAAYDSNPTLSFTNASSDYRGAVQANAAYNWSEKLNTNYQLYVSKHIENTSYNVVSHNVTLQGLLNVFQTELKTGYRYGLNYLDGEVWLNQHNLFSSFGIVSDRFGQVTLGMNLSSDQYQGIQSDSGYSGVISVEVRPTPKKSLVTKVKAHAQVSVDPEFSFKDQTFGLNISTQYVNNQWTFFVSGSGDYLLYPESAQEESKFNIKTTAAVSKIWIERLRTNLKLDILSSMAEPESFGYQRFVITSSLGWSF